MFLASLFAVGRVIVLLHGAVRHASVSCCCGCVHDAAGPFWSVLHEYDDGWKRLGGKDGKVGYARHVTPTATMFNALEVRRTTQQVPAQSNGDVMEGTSPHPWAVAVAGGDGSRRADTDQAPLSRQRM
jgi:hypothetical protein